MIDFSTLNDLTFFAFTGVDPYKGANIRKKLRTDQKLRDVYHSILQTKKSLLCDNKGPGEQAIKCLINYAGSLMVIKVKDQYSFNVVMN